MVALCSELLSGLLGNHCILFINIVSCSELLFDRLELRVSYSDNVPDLCCKDRSGGYRFICRFHVRVRMIAPIAQTCKMIDLPFKCCFTNDLV